MDRVHLRVGLHPEPILVNGSSNVYELEINVHRLVVGIQDGHLLDNLRISGSHSPCQKAGITTDEHSRYISPASCTICRNDMNVHVDSYGVQGTGTLIRHDPLVLKLSFDFHQFRDRYILHTAAPTILKCQRRIEHTTTHTIP